MGLWREGRNFLHGTGHGVGHHLNVHEGPQTISPRGVQEELKPGMVTTVEPGIYRVGKYGFRTENMVLCVEDGETDFGKFLRFETLTLCPICRDLIDPTRLTPEEEEWLDRYHQTVYEKLSPFLEDPVREWLERATAPLSSSVVK